MKRKIVIAEGTGFLGSILLKHFDNDNDEVIVLTRKTRSPAGNVRYVFWDGKTYGTWALEMENSDVIINLAGKSVNCRYSEKNKSEIVKSRVDSTLIIGQAIKKCIFPPKLWINAGSAAIFGNSGDEIKHEYSSVGNGFSPEVCKQWERAFNSSILPYTRKVFLRIGLVLQPLKGLIKPFANLVKFGLGGKIGTGEQYISWIHEKDFAEIVNIVIERPEIEGILHCSSPFPVKNKDFMATIRNVSKVKIGIPNPGILVRIGAIFIGTEACLVLEGRRVVSRVLPDLGFKFSFPKIDSAMNHLLA